MGRVFNTVKAGWSWTEPVCTTCHSAMLETKCLRVLQMATFEVIVKWQPSKRGGWRCHNHLTMGITYDGKYPDSFPCTLLKCCINLFTQKWQKLFCRNEG